MINIFLQISLILVIVLIVSILMKLLKQPLIIGYILSGIIIGPVFLNLIRYNETISLFSELGIALLLFIVGLHLSPKVIKEVGKLAVITGVGQVTFTLIIGYVIASSLGFSHISAIYLALALTFSSTIIVMRLLSDKGAIEKLYGKIAIGFLLVQDLIAITVLIIISSFSTGGDFNTIIINLLFKGILIAVLLFVAGYYILPKLSEFFARSQELLFLFSIVWGLSIGALLNYLGFSIEVGALIAGIALSSSPYTYEISSKLKPLKDFFIISFFLVLGSQMVFTDLTHYIVPIIIFSLVILIGNPFIVMTLIGLCGYSKNTGFMAGVTVAQVSEFSLILVVLGIKLGHIKTEILSIIAVVSLITIAGSTYLIMYSDKIYPHISNYLSIFERKKLKEKKGKKESHDYFLLGENRIGFSIMKTFINTNKNYVVIDYNPERLKRIKRKGVNTLYGDVSNYEFLDEINIDKAKLVVSTIPEIETNLLILRKIRKKNKKAIIIVTSRTISETFELYKSGANYVILPHFSGGEYTARLIEEAGTNIKKYESEKFKQIKELKERLDQGQEYFKSK